MVPPPSDATLQKLHCVTCKQWCPPVQSEIDKAESDRRELTKFEQYCLVHYPTIVGEMSYYARTCRPDSSYVLSKLSTRQKAPDKAAAIWASQSLRYLKTTGARKQDVVSISI